MPRIRLAGLDPAVTYTLTEKNVRVGQRPCPLCSGAAAATPPFSPRFLIHVGLEVPPREEYASRVFELTSN